MVHTGRKQEGKHQHTQDERLTVVEVGVPRGPGAVEGKGQLLVVLVLLAPHPKGLEHLDCKRDSCQPTGEQKTAVSILGNEDNL